MMYGTELHALEPQAEFLNLMGTTMVVHPEIKWNDEPILRIKQARKEPPN